MAPAGRPLMPSPDLSTLPPNSMAVDGGAGAGAASDDDDWLRVYGRVVAMLPRVKALAAGRARLEAANALQHEFWEARDAILQRRLLQEEESRRRLEAAYIDRRPSRSGDDRKFLELQESDYEDLTTFVDVLAAENTEFQIKLKEVDAAVEHSQNAADHEHITRDLEAELRKLKMAYESLRSEKDKKISQLTAERDFVRDQFKTLEWDYDDILSYSNKKEARAAETYQELQLNVEQLKVPSVKKDGEIRRLRAQAKAAEAKTKMVEGKLQKVYFMPKEIGGEVENFKDQQPASSRKNKKDMSEKHKKGCSEGHALRAETQKSSCKQMLDEDGQPEVSQKRKCVGFVSADNEQNGNDYRASNQVVEPPKKKRVSAVKEVEQENYKELANSKVHGEGNRSPHELAIYNSLLYLRTVKDNFTDKPEKHKEFLAIQSDFVSRKIDVESFINAVKVLLDGHPELISGFKSCFTCTPTQVLGNTNTKC